MNMPVLLLDFFAAACGAAVVGALAAGVPEATGAAALALGVAELVSVACEVSGLTLAGPGSPGLVRATRGRMMP
jgi:hypothetical protein